MLKIAIIGGSGYTGLELLRLLGGHNECKLVGVTSRQYEKKPVPEVFPSLKGFYDNLEFKGVEEVVALDADLFFCALPHGASMEVASALVGNGKRVIDLSADFRLRSASVYEHWYGCEHTSTELLEEAVYGLTELNADAIKDAKLVANPGCYPTSALLALAPAVKEGVIDTGTIIIDSKSGVSGAGRGASIDTSFVEIQGGFKPYKVGCHRHLPEIEQELSGLAHADVSVTFTPHLLPVSRGLMSTVYARLVKDLATDEIADLYQSFYKGKPFVRLTSSGVFPNISSVRASNFCDIAVSVDQTRSTLVIVSAIDNLVKGASGQAVQNMNIMFGMPETMGLTGAPQSI